MAKRTSSPSATTGGLYIQRYLVTGFLVVLPLWVTWLIFQFLLGLLSRLGQPGVQVLSLAAEHRFPRVAEVLAHPWFGSAAAVIIIVIGLYLLGWFAAQVLGRQIIDMLERAVYRIPVIKTIYGPTKKIVGAFYDNPEQVQRVVLIDFPSPDMKTIGLVTRVIRDTESQRELAVVYVPTSPNPTSGYMEIVPMDLVTPIDWSIDQAMSFILTGGTNSPDSIRYWLRQPPPPNAKAPNEKE
jgi:uncharacterized membrane protein